MTNAEILKDPGAPGKASCRSTNSRVDNRNSSFIWLSDFVLQSCSAVRRWARQRQAVGAIAVITPFMVAEIGSGGTSVSGDLASVRGPSRYQLENLALYINLQYNCIGQQLTANSSGDGGMTKSNQLMVRLDDESKSCVAKAAELRKVSISDYIRMVAVAQARREVSEAGQNTIAMAPNEQLAFWNALNETPDITAAQRELGRLMQGQE